MEDSQSITPSHSLDHTLASVSCTWLYITHRPLVVNHSEGKYMRKPSFITYWQNHVEECIQRNLLVCSFKQQQRLIHQNSCLKCAVHSSSHHKHRMWRLWRATSTSKRVSHNHYKKVFYEGYWRHLTNDSFWSSILFLVMMRLPVSHIWYRCFHNWPQKKSYCKASVDSTGADLCFCQWVPT